MLSGVVALATPVVCAQDALRFSAIRSGRPSRALLSDGTWLGLVASSLLWGADRSPLLAIGTWALAAVVAFLALAIQVRPRFDWAGARSILTLSWGSSEVTVLGVALSSGAFFAVMGVAVAVIGTESAAALRGAGTMMGPVNILLAS